jgi:hypothetical protein
MWLIERKPRSWWWHWLLPQLSAFGPKISGHYQHKCAVRHDEANIHIWQWSVQCTMCENTVLNEVHAGRTRNLNWDWLCIPTLFSLSSSTPNVSISFPSWRSSFSNKCIASKSRRPRLINNTAIPCKKIRGAFFRNFEVIFMDIS